MNSLPQQSSFFKHIDHFNTFLGVTITNAVGTMWCAYFFTLLALLSLPAAFASHDLLIIVAWIAQTFLQLVLLSIIMFGQNTQGAITEHKLETILQTILSNQLTERQEVDEIDMMIKEKKV
ncbi:MAG: hypothetical protein ACRDFB_03745 [Rhabdochlamydiaceae bacterium]